MGDWHFDTDPIDRSNRRFNVSHSAKIICDSISPDGIRLTTMEVVFPRIILAEFNTHRMFSRNSASSRAIPVEKMIKMVEENPYIPSSWGQNQKGMQAGQEVTEAEAEDAIWTWLQARDEAVGRARGLLEIGIHKQTTNRLLEPFMWHTVIVSATEWSNFFHLRNHSAAHPDIQIVAKLMQEQYETNVPNNKYYGEWHLPYTVPEDFNHPINDVINASIMRCARVSFMRHDGQPDTIADASACVKQLLTPGHMSPLEHVARPAQPKTVEECQAQSNFKGWIQYRKMILGESDIFGYRKATQR